MGWSSPQSTTPFMKRCLLIPLLLWTVASATAAPLPMICELTSEQSASTKVRLTERTTGSLKGVFHAEQQGAGNFSNRKTKAGKGSLVVFSKPRQQRQGSLRPVQKRRGLESISNDSSTTGHQQSAVCGTGIRSLELEHVRQPKRFPRKQRTVEGRCWILVDFQHLSRRKNC